MHGLCRALRAEWALGRLSLALLKAAPGRKQNASAAYYYCYTGLTQPIRLMARK
jgi:hypothetical protein